MPSMSSGKIVRKRKTKGGTAHTKNHRWESFTAKIAKFNSLDPLRRVRRHDLDAEDLSTRTSYFRDGLERWQDLNLSATFVDFSYAVTPLADSLPQILHFEGKIADLLIESLKKNDRQAYEPLLSLLTDFAHDIGTRFEKHYERTLKVVASIVAAPQDVEVIEWGFTCLAFLFKYLSKLLISDLRPTYDLMASLLGKERQRPHIARFAAESMSFLLKRAGASVTKREALANLMSHMKDDLLSAKDTKHFVLYYHGIMTMLSESMKGNGFTLHTSAGAILQSMLSCLDENDFSVAEHTVWTDVTCGVLTSVIHHTNVETLQPIVEILLQFTGSSVNSASNQWTVENIGRVLYSSRMLGVLIGVRQASRVSDWSLLLSMIQDILRLFSRNSSTVNSVGSAVLWKSLILTVSEILQYAPMDAIIPKLANIMNTLTKDPFAPLFLTFCSYYAKSDAERFRSVVYSSFQRFVVSHWSDSPNEDTLCVLLPELASFGLLYTNEKDRFHLPQSWQDQIVSKFEKLEVSPFPEQAPASSYDRGPQVWHERCLPKYHALLVVLECSSVHPSTNARIAEILLRKLKLALRPSSSLATSEAHFIMGRGFEAYIRMSNICGKPEKSLGPLLRAAASRYSQLPRFVNAMISYERSVADSLKTQQADHDNHVMVNALVQNLSTSSHDLRLLSMRLLEILYPEDEPILEVLKIMLRIELTPMDLSTARLASLYIRKLASVYVSLEPTSLLNTAIPAFCFGMMTIKFSQLWVDAASALALIAGTKLGEQVVTTTAFDWLMVPSQQREDVRNTAEEHDLGLTDFECSNLMHLMQTANDVYNNVRSAQNIMLRQFEDEQALISATSANARPQALKVFSYMPSLAEKHSRQLVPMFLSWASHDKYGTQNDSDGLPSDWSRKDQKALLDLFALFKNPKVLFRSEEVFSALLNLLANGELEIQKSALKAVLGWRLPGIKPYEENLQNLLDEARFKEEIALLFQGDSPIQPEHKDELRPVLLRLLYGRSISRKGAASGKQGMEARRLIILRSLGTQDIGIFLDIALGGLRSIRLSVDGADNGTLFDREIISVRKQVGFMHMVEPIIRELGSKIEPFIGSILTAILYCMVAASRRLSPISEAKSDESEASQDSLLKVIRQSGFRCLVQIFSNGLSIQDKDFVPFIMRELISPKLEDLPIEIAQGISGLLQLLSTWSTSTKTVMFLADDLRILPKLVDALAPNKTQEAVKLFILNIIHHVLMAAQGSADGTTVASRVRTNLLEPNLDRILQVIGGVLRTQQNGSKALLEANINAIVELAPFVSSSKEARNLVDISIFLLNQPSRRVNPKVKNRLLSVLEHFIPLYELQDDEVLRDGVYDTISSLFGFFKDHASRDILSNVLLIFSRIDPVLITVAEYCKDLNSFEEGKLDEPDYDRRLGAFTKIQQESSSSFTPYQWRPLLYNMLFFIKDDEEFGVLASNSSDGLCHFLDVAARSDTDSSMTRFNSMISDILLPAIFSGVREPSEVTRREYVKVIAHLIKAFPSRSDISDLHPLLRGDEELESSFFNNILSAGKGRQSSALGQVTAVAENGDLSSRNVSQFFIPLLEFFVFDRAEGNEAHNLAAEASTTIAALANCLEWSQFRALLKRYITYVTSKPELEKQIIRLVGRVIDVLAVNALDAHAAGSSDDSHQPATTNGRQKRLAATLPTRAKFSNELVCNVLPPLSEYVHGKDESTVSLRVPVAIILVRLFKLLPEEQLNDKLPAVLTDICHILRSKAQESRDMARDTLTKICVLLGPSCFGFVLKELRGALARGYQLHVLSYTMHSILVATTPNYVPGDLDYCLPSIVAVIMDDIFGVTGQEKDAEEYVSKMKEVKSSKSRDSMELIAKTATLRRLTEIIRPIRTLLREKLNIRMVNKIDDLLSRLSTGLLQNPAVNSQDSLIFCYEVIHDSYAIDEPQEKHKEDYKLKKYLIQKGAAKSGNRASTTVNSHKLVSFSFDILRLVLRKYDHLRNEANLAGFIPLIGDALTNGEEEVKIAVFKLLTGIVKVPFKSQNVSNLYKLGAVEAIKSVAISSNTKSDMAQAALRLLSAILKDKNDVSVKDTSIDEIINRLKDDITNPELRHVTFNFLRSVMDSKMQTATIYDMLDYVGTVMVTNDDKDTRDLARGAYFQFLRDYPQMKKRWTKQLNFIVANLKYDREGGRLSILEVVLLLLSKSVDEFAQETATTCFLPLVLMLVNDESEKCRIAAGAVIQEIFQRADNARLQTFLGLLRGWIVQHENSPVLQLAFQAYGFGVRTRSQEVLGDLPPIRVALLAVLGSVEDPLRWEILHNALRLALDILETVPEWILAGDQEDLWKAVQRCLSFPHISVKLSAARLVGALMADFAKSNIESGLVLPLKGSMGLELFKDGARDLIRRFAGMLRTPDLSEQLAAEIIKSLAFLGRTADASELEWNTIEDLDDDDAEIEIKQKPTALGYLCGRMSFILRREISPPRAYALIPKTSAMHLLQILTSKIAPKTLSLLLPILLLPLHNLTDPSIPRPYSTDDQFKAGYEKLKSDSQELMFSLQSRCGTSLYTAQLMNIRADIKSRRLQRTSKRRIEAVSAPEKYGKDKKKKVERKKERRKERGQEHRDLRRAY